MDSPLVKKLSEDQGWVKKSNWKVGAGGPSRVFESVDVEEEQYNEEGARRVEFDPSGCCSVVVVVVWISVCSYISSPSGDVGNPSSSLSEIPY